MRTFVLVTSILVGLTSAAAAGDDIYPSELVDRPLWLPADVTEVAMGVSSSRNRATDRALGDVVQSSLGAMHSFGWIEPYGGLALNVRKQDVPGAQTLARTYAGAKVPVTERGAIDVEGFWLFPANPDVTWTSFEGTFQVKQPLLPHRAALFSYLGATYEHVAAKATDDTVNMVSLIGGGTVEVQATSQLAFTASTSLGVTIGQTPGTERKDLVVGVGGGLLYNVERVDLGASLWLRDVTRDADPSLYASASARF